MYDAPSTLAASIDESEMYLTLCLSKQIPNAENVPGRIMLITLLSKSNF